MSKCILITGCSSGIGSALAREFHQRGHTVYATAGFSQVGAVLDLQRDDLRRQYETNVIAPIAVTRAALRLLRASVKAGDGRSAGAVIANIGSIVGLFTTPFAGAYCSSKAALHSLSDTLRMEVAPFGIHVVTVQPGGVLSSFGAHAEAAIQLPANSLYRGVEKGIHARAQAGQVGATAAEVFVIPVVEALLQAAPPIRVRGGKGSTLFPLLKMLLPARRFDAVLSRKFGLTDWRP